MEQIVPSYWKVTGSDTMPLFCALLSWKNPSKWNLNLIKRALLPTFVTLSSPSIRQKPFRCSQLTSRCQSSQGLGPVCARLRAYEKNFYMLLHSLPTPPFASFKLWQSVVPERSLASVGPSHPCTRWPSTRFFHPVGSRTHLFSTSKTQGLRGVMIGFLLCNLLEFCLTSKMAFSCPLHAHTPSEVCTGCKQLSVDL